MRKVLRKEENGRREGEGEGEGDVASDVIPSGINAIEVAIFFQVRRALRGRFGSLHRGACPERQMILRVRFYGNMYV